MPPPACQAGQDACDRTAASLRLEGHRAPGVGPSAEVAEPDHDAASQNQNAAIGSDRVTSLLALDGARLNGLQPAIVRSGLHFERTIELR